MKIPIAGSSSFRHQVRAEEFDQRLDLAWNVPRSSGLIAGPIARIRDHAAGYIPAAWRVRPPELLVDLGSGVGVPGIHLAGLLPRTTVILVDSSAQRCETARLAVMAVELVDRVSVRHARADDLASEGEWRESAAGVVSRLFGPPSELAECGLPLVVPGGRLVVSVSSTTLKWWKSAPLEGLGARWEGSWSTDAGSYVAVAKDSPTPPRFPRRTPARKRRPWPDT